MLIMLRYTVKMPPCIEWCKAVFRVPVYIHYLPSILRLHWCFKLLHCRHSAACHSSACGLPCVVVALLICNFSPALDRSNMLLQVCVNYIFSDCLLLQGVCYCSPPIYLHSIPVNASLLGLVALTASWLAFLQVSFASVIFKYSPYEPCLFM